LHGQGTVMPARHAVPAGNPLYMKILYRAAVGTLENICGLGHFPILNEQFRYACPVRAACRALSEVAMLDVIMLAIGFGFFALLVGYGLACDWL